MTRTWMARVVPTGPARYNCLAGLIVACAAAILVLSFHASPAGAGGDLEPPNLSISPSAPPSADPRSSSPPVALSAEDAAAEERMLATINGSRLALQLHATLLELGVQRLQHLPDYTATFVKQERVDGACLQELQTMQVKIRHRPFSVFLKWTEGGDTGREIMYVEGIHDNKMLVRLGGLKGRLMPYIKLDPNDSTAMSEARHPVSDMGLVKLAEKLIGYRKRDLSLKNGVRWEMTRDQQFGERDCYCFIVEYASKTVEPVYRKSITYIDKELALPVCVQNYGWPEDDRQLEPGLLDDETLIEYYGYTEIQFNQQLTDSDFEKQTVRR